MSRGQIGMRSESRDWLRVRPAMLTRDPDTAFQGFAQRRCWFQKGERDVRYCTSLGHSQPGGEVDRDRLMRVRRRKGKSEQRVRLRGLLVKRAPFPTQKRLHNFLSLKKALKCVLFEESVSGRQNRVVTEFYSSRTVSSSLVMG